MGMGPFEVGPAGDNFVLFCEFECLKEQRCAGAFVPVAHGLPPANLAVRAGGVAR